MGETWYCTVYPNIINSLEQYDVFQQYPVHELIYYNRMPQRVKNILLQTTKNKQGNQLPMGNLKKKNSKEKLHHIQTKSNIVHHKFI